jgi:hypothetical protein
MEEGLTNDLLYESNDSLDIVNGSLSKDSLVRVLDDVPEGFDRFSQKPFFSVGLGFIN